MSLNNKIKHNTKLELQELFVPSMIDIFADMNKVGTEKIKTDKLENETSENKEVLMIYDTKFSFIELEKNEDSVVEKLVNELNIYLNNLEKNKKLTPYILFYPFIYTCKDSMKTYMKFKLMGEIVEKIPETDAIITENTIELPKDKETKISLINNVVKKRTRKIQK